MPETAPNYTLEDIAYLSGDPESAEREQSERGRAFLAVSAAMVWPGLGHLFVGKPRSGAAWCIVGSSLAAAVLSVLFWPQLLPALIVLLPLGVIVQLLQMAHASHCGKRSQRPMLGNASRRFLVGAILGACGLGECYGTIRYLQNNWFEICFTPTDSMGPNVSPGDFFLNFKQQPYQRWDIVGVNAPPGVDLPCQNLCKRIVGMPGDTVEITGSALLINGKPTTLPPNVGPYFAVDTWNTPMLDAEPMAAANGCWGRPITLGPDEYFLLGDNNRFSYDARLWPSFEDHQPGATPRDQLCGRVVGIVWPPQRWRVFEQQR
ncbi:MAG: signal peptidase I [Tepidisphaeraceae bacterium]|jgi:signal peptidase I